MTKATRVWAGVLLLVIGVGTLALSRPDSLLAAAPRQTAPLQSAPTVVPTAAISLSPTADLSGIADNTETPGELLVAEIVFTIVGIVVVVTVFLVWKTRPKRQ